MNYTYEVKSPQNGKLDVGDIIDLYENIYIDCDVSRKMFAREISSFADFKIGYYAINKCTMDSIMANPIDFEAEFAQFLEERGCKNEEELKIIAKAHCYTMDDFLGKAGFVIQSQINTMIANGSHGGSGGTIAEMKDYVLENANLADLGDLLAQKDANSQYTKLREIIENLPFSTNLAFSKEEAISMIDKMLEILDKRPKSPLSEGQQMFNTNLISRYHA